MSISSSVIENYGEKMTVGEANAKGFISAIDWLDDEITKTPLAAGVKNGARYRLITNAAHPAEKMRVRCGGLEYEITRVEQVRIFGSFSHNECILRLKGGCADA